MDNDNKISQGYWRAEVHADPELGGLEQDPDGRVEELQRVERGNGFGINLTYFRNLSRLYGAFTVSVYACIFHITLH